LLAVVLLAAFLVVEAAFLIGTLSCRARLVEAATARADLCSLEGGVTKSLSDCPVGANGTRASNAHRMSIGAPTGILARISKPSVQRGFRVVSADGMVQSLRRRRGQPLQPGLGMPHPGGLSGHCCPAAACRLGIGGEAQ